MRAKRLLLALLIISIFVFAVGSATFYVQYSMSCGYCIMPIPMFIPALSAVGFIMGGLAYYYMKYESSDRCRRFRKLLNLLSRRLPPQERSIIEMLSRRDWIYQSEISRKLGKVRAYRSIRNLEKAGIIRRERAGSTYIIRLNHSEKEQDI